MCFKIPKNCPASSHLLRTSWIVLLTSFINKMGVTMASVLKYETGSVIVRPFLRGS